LLWIINALSCFVILALGACIGSFLNVVIYRIPAGQSILYPPSSCPHCNHRLGLTENVPILGWLWLRGRCRHCQGSIARRYPVIEAVTALLFGVCFGLFGISWQTLGHWIFLSWLLALAVIDLDTMTLPNVLTRSGLVVGLIFQIFMGVALTATGVGAIQGFMTGVGGAVLGIWLLESLGLILSTFLGQQALGGGDPKLAAMIGAWLGWERLLLSLFLAAFVGTAIGVGAIGFGQLQRGQRFPFGPLLAIGALGSALWGQQLWDAYLNWLL
jgi:leader peptidase (prepilin peptidase)/N-methyltransferase